MLKYCPKLNLNPCRCIHGNMCTCAYPPFSIVYLSDCWVPALIFIESPTAWDWEVCTCCRKLPSTKQEYRSPLRFMFSGLDFLRNKLWWHQLPLQSIFCMLFYLKSLMPYLCQGRTAPSDFPASWRLVPTLVSQETGLGWILVRTFRIKSVFLSLKIPLISSQLLSIPTVILGF